MSTFSVVNKGLYKVKFFVRAHQNTESRYVAADNFDEAMSLVRFYAENLYGDVAITGIDKLYDCFIIPRDMITELCGCI